MAEPFTDKDRKDIAYSWVKLILKCTEYKV